MRLAVRGCVLARSCGWATSPSLRPCHERRSARDFRTELTDRSTRPTRSFTTRGGLGRARPFRVAQASPARRKPQPVALAEHRDAPRIDLEPGLRPDRRHGLAGRGLHEVGQLLKVALEPAGRDDLEDPAGLVARVPESVPLAARLEYEVARPGHDDLAAEVRAHPALEHERVLVLAAVAVQRRPRRPGGGGGAGPRPGRGARGGARRRGGGRRPPTPTPWIGRSGTPVSPPGRPRP